MALDSAAAEKAIAENIGQPLGLDTVQAAAAISSLVEDNMANEISSRRSRKDSTLAPSRSS